jgi:hypothetical protein
MNLLEFKACTCGGVARKQVQSLSKKVHEFRLNIHRIPHYECPKCHHISFDEEIDVNKISEWAYHLKIKDLIWNPLLTEMIKLQKNS